MAFAAVPLIGLTLGITDHVEVEDQLGARGYGIRIGRRGQGCSHQEQRAEGGRDGQGNTIPVPVVAHGWTPHVVCRGMDRGGDRRDRPGLAHPRPTASWFVTAGSMPDCRCKMPRWEMPVPARVSERSRPNRALFDTRIRTIRC